MFTTDAFNYFKCAQDALDQIPKWWFELNTQVQFQSINATSHLPFMEFFC